MKDFFFYLLLFIFNFCLLISFKKICNFLNLIDYPNKLLKKHKKKVPIFGGIYFLSNIIIYLFLDNFFNIYNEVYYFSTGFKQSILFILLILVITIIGLYDDRYFLSPFKKIFLLFFVLFFLISSNASMYVTKINFFDFFFSINFSTFIFSTLCVMFLINAYNFYDGINGNLLINFVPIIFYFYYLTGLNIILFIFIISAVFAYFNYKNYFFLGDGGAYCLSILLSIILINLSQINLILKAEHVILLLFYPAIDLLRLLFVRIVSGKNPFMGDLNHFHHIGVRKFGFQNFSIIHVTIVILNIISIELFSDILKLILVLNFFLYIYIVTTKSNKIVN